MNSEETAKFLSLVAHPIRVEIVKFLDNKPRSYSDLMKNLSIESTGKLSFHLEKLSPLVVKNNQGYYELTDLGVKTYSLLTALENGNAISEFKNEDQYSIDEMTFLAVNQETGTQGAKPFFLVAALSISCITFVILLVMILNSLGLYFPSPIYALLMAFVLLYPGLAFFLYYYLCRRYNLTFRALAFGMFSLLILVLFMHNFGLATMYFDSYHGSSSYEQVFGYLTTLMLGEGRNLELAVYPSYPLSIELLITVPSLFFLLWSVIYGIILLCLKLLSRSQKLSFPVSSEQLPSDFPKWALVFNRSEFWLISIPVYGILVVLANKLQYDVTPRWQDTSNTVLTTQGNIFPEISAIFPVIPTFLLILTVYVLYYRHVNVFSKKSNVLLIVIIIGPLLLFFAAILDSLMLLGSAEMNEPGMLFKIVLFLVSKNLTAMIQALGLTGFSLMILKLVSGKKTTENILVQL
ncbi:MAG: winged helix-turn-helix domain-containing protein [Candidatus Odinarchaeota archaeon]